MSKTPTTAAGADEPEYLLIMPANTLSKKAVQKVAGGSGIDMTAIAKAEKALDALKVDFDNWMNDEVDKLLKAHAGILKYGPIFDHLQALYNAAHDVRGQAATFGYPLAGSIADNLCHYLDEHRETGNLSTPFIEVHVNAIKAILREHVRDRENPLAVQIRQELQDARKRFAPETADRVSEPITSLDDL